MYVGVKKVDVGLRVFAFKFDGWIYAVDILEEFEQGFLARHPDEEDVIFERCVGPMPIIDLGVYVLLFEITHEYIRIGFRAFGAHVTAFHL